MRCLLLLLLAALLGSLCAEDLSALRADRSAIERVYYNHRLGTKPPFEEALPTTLLDKMVQQDLHKETVLKKAYGIAITPEMVNAEVQRINTTTRAPEVLAELKAALGNDTNRFAQTVARPIVVERLLRDKFENDDQLHASQRREAENLRNALLAAKRDGSDYDKLLALVKQGHSNSVSEITWQLAPRTEADRAESPDAVEIRKRYGPDAQILSSPQNNEQGKFYFDDLPGRLSEVLRAQLREPADVSAVIETPGGFLLYVLKEKTAATLSAASLNLPKLDYEQWLAAQ